jgi:quaternary ammonium compound-resistance protein SugE
MAWVILIVAGIFEVGWAVGLKFTEGFTRVWPSILTVCAMVISMALLGVAIRTLPLGTAYAVWTGIGTAGTVLLGCSHWANPHLLFGSSSCF